MHLLADAQPNWIDELLNPWVIFGFAAQFAFFMRFVVQWIASERRGRSYVPVVFWYFSLAGGVMLFIYACKRRDPVFIAGQGLGCFIYIRNLVLIHRRSARVRDRRGSTLDALMDDGLEDSTGSSGASDGTSSIARSAGPQGSAPSAPRQFAPTSHA
jgi:lipid-A-disaccharide synthase-like uncharacterized protein